MPPVPPPGTIIGRLETIDTQLAGTEGFEGIQDRLERTAEAVTKKKAAYELAFAQAYIDAKGSNQKERESNALLSLAKSDEYKDFIAAEAEHKAVKLVHTALQDRISIAQSVLKAQKEESFR